MKILHTSDWHLGRRLYDFDRYDAFEQFLSWLLSMIETEKIDALVVAGDIFDTCVPTHRSQAMYYDFLARLGKTCCRHAVIVGGNHDSPTQLNAPQNILSHLGIYVVGGAESDPAREIVELRDEEGKLEGVVCAIPYLRERDILRIKADSQLSRDEEIVAATKDHYETVVKKAVETIGSSRVPLIATGHLMTANSKVGHDENALYIGSLGIVPSSVFPSVISYLALGHIHKAQLIGGDRTRNYSGAPIPFNFDEASHAKIVRVVEFDKEKVKAVSDLPVPSFDRIVTVRGKLSDIEIQLDQIKVLSEQNPSQPVLAQIIHEDTSSATNLVETVQRLIAGTSIQVVRVEDTARRFASLAEGENVLTIEQLDPMSVFDKRLEQEEVEEEMREKLVAIYRSVVDMAQMGQSFATP
ncbi:exonuclease subunit SbcD [Parasutterella muris]|uniref:exonuclease subunit SbcD n=1 Tax=Parasutterella muris TaxID=2565572 RepID=UPI0020418F83|nr:exonuclease subunit SbcD [Parasutterella muris]